MERREVTSRAEGLSRACREGGVLDAEGDLQLSSPWSAVGKASDPEHRASVRISGHYVVLRY